MENWKLLAGILGVIVVVSLWYNQSMMPDSVDVATKKCVAENRLDSLCVALANDDPSRCSQDLSPEDCHATFVIAKVLEGKGSCEGIEDDAYAAVCQALASKDEVLCDQGGEDALQCRALVSDNMTYCDSYQEPALRELCSGRVYWQRAMKSNDPSLCAKMTDLAEIMACDVMLTKNANSCPMIKSSMCRSMAQQEQGLHNQK